MNIDYQPIFCPLFRFIANSKLWSKSKFALNPVTTSTHHPQSWLSKFMIWPIPFTLLSCNLQINLQNYPNYSSNFWMLPHMIFFYFKNVFYQKQCKYAMNIGLAQKRGVLLHFFMGKNYLFISLPMLPSISKITSRPLVTWCCK